MPQYGMNGLEKGDRSSHAALTRDDRRGDRGLGLTQITEAGLE
jgi:hypothetical protein